MITASELLGATQPRAPKATWPSGLRPGPQRKGDQPAPQAVAITAKLMLALRKPCTWKQLSEIAEVSDATLKRYLRAIHDSAGLITPGRGGDVSQPRYYRLP